MREIEILVKVNDSKEKVLDILNTLKFIGEKSVTDVYFSDPLRKDLQPDERGRLTRCFRMRRKGEDTSMAYKVDHFDDNDQWIYSDEYETSVGSFEKTVEIMELLGLKRLVTIENTKYTFVTNDYEIVLEDVKDLGLHMEVEYLNTEDERDASEIKKEIWKFIENLGIDVSEESNIGKPELMLRKSAQRSDD